MPRSLFRDSPVRTPRSILKKTAFPPEPQESGSQSLNLTQYISERIEDELGADDRIDEADSPQFEPEDPTFSQQPLTFPVSSGSSLHLRSVQEISPKYRSIFKSFPYFNVVQSRVFNDATQSDRSLVVSAPTGSGKTVLFELAMIRLLERASGPERGKMIYMSPMKSLCGERFRDWKTKFGSLGVQCLELTGE